MGPDFSRVARGIAYSARELSPGESPLLPPGDGLFRPSEPFSRSYRAFPSPRRGDISFDAPHRHARRRDSESHARDALGRFAVWSREREFFLACVAAHGLRTGRHVLRLATHAGGGEGAPEAHGAARCASIVSTPRQQSATARAYSRTRRWSRPTPVVRNRHAASPERDVPRAATHEGPVEGARDAWGRPRAGGPTHTSHAHSPTRCRLTPHGERARTHATCEGPHAVHVPSHAVHGAPHAMHVLPHAVYVPSHAVRHRCHVLRADGHALPLCAHGLHVGAHAWCFTHHDARRRLHTRNAHRHAGALGLHSELRRCSRYGAFRQSKPSRLAVFFTVASSRPRRARTTVQRNQP
jgi:hypothetical protein